MVNSKRCLIIAAVPVNDTSVFEEYNSNEYLVICADKGYENAEKYGITPDYIVGDFDSSKSKPHFPEDKVRVLPVEKDVTDTMYAAMLGLELGCREFIIVGGSGGERFDHTIANYNVMLFLQRKSASCVMIDDYTKAFLINGKRLNLTQMIGKTVSIFPFGCTTCNLTLRGLKYEITQQDITAGGLLMGVSNSVASDRAEITVHYGNALIIVSDF